MTIEAEDVVAEYTGEIVGDAVCDAREAYYRKLGIADYMFRMGADEVVDATLRGSRARYINHSCDPNCFAAIHTLPEPPSAAPVASSEDSEDSDEDAEGLGRGGEGMEGVEEGGAGGAGSGVGAASSPALAHARSSASGLTPWGHPIPSYSGKRVFVYALRRILPGEELLYDYSFSAEEAPVACKCRAASCRGTINN